jgi:sugar lactone lactonase YvrE
LLKQLACRIRLSLLLVTSACGASADPDESPRGIWSDATSWRLVELARFGATEGDGPEVFSNVIDLTVDPLGRPWIADAQESTIRVFDDAGRHVRTIGRKGAGPGEFGSIAGMQWDTKGRLWVLDAGNARFAIYDTAGALIETRPRQAVMSTSPWPGRFDRQGRLYDVDGGLAADGTILTSIVRSREGEQTRDTFAVPDFKAELFELRQGDSRNRMISQINVPFTGTQLWAVAPDGSVWITNTARYRLERHAFDSGIQQVIERKHTPVPVTVEERERRLEDYRNFVRKGGRIDESRIPDTHPALINFLVDDEGNLWVSPTPQAGDGRVMDVFRPDGQYLGRVPLGLPQRSSPRVIRNNRMLVVTRDSLDVPSVTLLRVDKPGQ